VILTKLSDEPMDWDIDELRPIVDREEYYKQVDFKETDFEPATFPSSHGIFTAHSRVESLPAISKATVRHLLGRPFSSAKGKTWVRSSETGASYAPTTKAGFHIVPKDYDGALIEVSKESCMKCHQTTAKHASDFQPGRDWYGRVRGSDGIFSFHAFDSRHVSHGGLRVDPVLRKDMLEFIER